eukprot:1370477-Amorphochlora_amoeboformis.AAC.1
MSAATRTRALPRLLLVSPGTHLRSQDIRPLYKKMVTSFIEFSRNFLPISRRKILIPVGGHGNACGVLEGAGGFRLNILAIFRVWAD